MQEIAGTVRGRKLVRGRGGSSGATTTANKDAGGSRGGVDELTLGLGTTVAIIIILLASGAALATAYIVTYRPTCWMSRIDSTTVASAASQKDGGPAAVVATTAGSTASPLRGRPADGLDFPPACTLDQLDAVRKQLPAASCYEPAYLQACSFTVATKNCQNPKLVREFYYEYANDDNTETAATIATTAQVGGGGTGGFPFLGILVGWQQDDAPVDVLHMGSSGDPRYDRDRWNAKAGFDGSCRNASGTATATSTDRAGGSPRRHRGAQTLIVEWNSGSYKELSRLRGEFGYGDEEMLLDSTNPGDAPKETLTKLIATKFPGEDRPIHYLELGGRGELDHAILTEQLSSEVLKNVRYLAFEYSWKGTWAPADVKMSDLIERLKAQAGLVCYWSGDDSHGGLWRITDCWLKHYDTKQWAHIACVNARHGDVAQLKNRMETTFLETLGKEQKFGS
jgi:hypothetical protein